MNQKFGNIQLLRYLAAIGVVAFHQAGAYIQIHGLKELNRFSWGAKGVALFFVISGFVIVNSYSKKPVSARVFAINRFSRIVPSYWVLTLFATAIGMFFQVGGTPTGSEIQLWAWRIASFAFAAQPLGFSNPVLYQGWSLEYEMLFYAVFAGFVVLRFRGGALVYSTIAVLFVALFIPGFSFDVLGFVFGALVAHFAPRVPLPFRQFDYLAVLLVVLGLSVGFFSTSWQTEIIWLGSFAGLVYVSTRIRNLESSSVMALGAASYPIYLIQWFTVPLLSRASSAVFPSGHWLGQIVTILAAVALTTAVGLFWDQQIDKRMTNFTKTRLLSFMIRTR